MAQAGTPPNGTEPQNDGTNNPDPQNAAPAGAKRKIAGKYDSIEEAVEKGYVGLEQGFHSLSENVNKLTRIMESAMAGNDDPAYNATPVGRGGSSSDPYNRHPSPDDVDPKEFLLNPGEFLRKRDQQMLGQVANIVQNAVANAQVVNDFRSQNRDLSKHEKLVQIFLKDEDPRQPLRNRLDAAAVKAKAYLAQMKAEANGGNQPPAADDYIDRPAGAPYQQRNTQQSAPQSVNAEEQELVEYINERQAGYASHFGGPSQNSK